MLERILVATDGSDHADRALTLACGIAAACKSDLIVLHVITDRPLSTDEIHLAEVEFHLAVAKDYDPIPLREAQADPALLGRRLGAQAGMTIRRFREAHAQRLLEAAQRQAEASEVRHTETHHAVGDPAQVILEVAKARRIDLIVLGRRGLGDLQGLLLGSVSHKVAQLSDCACLTVK